LKKVQTETVTHTTIVTNHKPYEIELVAFDQLPFSSDSNIKVRVEEPIIKGNEHIRVDEFSLIQWRYKIAPEKSEKIQFTYVIEWPNDKQITLVPQFV